MPTIQVQINDDDFNFAMGYAVEKLLQKQISKDFLKRKGITEENFKNYNYSNDIFWTKIAANFAINMINNESDEWDLFAYSDDYKTFVEHLNKKSKKIK